jgi:TolA-binding protein
MSRKIRWIAILFLPLLLTSYSSGSRAAEEGQAAAHLARARKHWSDMNVSAAVAEWKQALQIDPQNAQAAAALGRLQEPFTSSDRFLAIAEKLIEQGQIKEAGAAVKRWKVQIVSRDQQARLQLIRGRLLLDSSPQDFHGALASFRSAEMLAESKEFKLKSRIAIGAALARKAASAAEGAALLARAVAQAEGTALAPEAAWQFIISRQMQPTQKIKALRKFLVDYPQANNREYQARGSLARLLEKETGAGGQRVVFEVWLGAYHSAANFASRAEACEAIYSQVSRAADRDALEWLALQLEKLGGVDDMELPTPPRELAALSYRRVAAIGRGEASLRSAVKFGSVIAGLLKDRPEDPRRMRWQNRRAESLLMQGQLLLLAGHEGRALSVLFKASKAYQSLLRQGRLGVGGTLLRIGKIMESRGRPDAAVHHYSLVARVFAAEKLGADSLWRLALVYRTRLDRPLEAVRALERYHDLYPPGFRVPTSAGDRIRKLGYPDVASFQAAHGLKADNVLGSETLAALVGEEINFHEVLAGTEVRRPVRGRLVHTVLYGIAQDLQSRGRYRESIHAYNSYLSMYPGHNLGDDALLAVAGMLRKNDLFQEAAAAYGRLIVDYPNGNKTSHAYLEAAYCWECLGSWQRARKYYDMFIKKFPRYTRAPEARRKLAAVRKLIKYQALLADGGLTDARKADAMYAMGRLLYKGGANHQKAAGIFQQIADSYPKTYHGPDARFSAGVCMLYEGNYSAARTQFGQLVKDFPESRLADDAQFWIGHTSEYQARELGRLDYRRIVLKRRSAKESSRLRSDLELRRRFWPQAKASGQAWHSAHPDLFRAGRRRDRVRAELQNAIAAYSKVVKNYRLGDMAQRSLLRIGHIYKEYLGNTDKAVEAYRQLLEKYPGSKAAVNAQFAVGEYYLEKKKLLKAEKAVTLFLSSFPNHARAADALLLLAECHRGQKKWVKALDDYQSYLTRYPHSRRAAEVREEVAWLKKYRF